jgi:pyruvate-formate lyase
VPKAISNDPQHWRTRAAEARAMAEQITDAKAKQAMLEIAENYEQIARRVERRLPTASEDRR